MDWLQRGDELWRKIREEGDELHRRREEHFGKVIKAMFSGLYHNPILQRALLAEGNVLQLKFLARLAGEELELPQPTEAEPQVDSGAVGEEATAAEDEDSSLIKILFLAANPADTDHLRLDAEMRAIDLALQQAAFRDRFELRQHWAVQVTDLQHCLLRHQPDIVHFSGHGSVLSEIILEDVSGNSRPVSVRALSTLFSILKDNIKCVVLNACYSEQQAQAIAQSIDCVIGMSKVIGDDAAIGFATAFYQALGFGRDVKTAFELGRVQIDLEGLDEQDTPKLLALKIPPENIFFIKQAQ
jgi:CHAT domain-containing protein